MREISDYIKREDAINIKDYLKRFGCFGDCGFVEIEGVLIALSKIPSADVAPVRHGCLVDAGVSASGHRLAMCTICKRKMREGVEIGIVSRYCPNCGAKMDEGEDDE